MRATTIQISGENFSRLKIPASRWRLSLFLNSVVRVESKYLLIVM